MQGKYLEYLTWQEAESLLTPERVVVLPVGARLKEHGLHLPLNNDWLTAEYLARRVTEACDVITVPTVPYGFYPAFVEYPGSISIGQDVFRDYIVDICRSLARHRARKFYVLNNGISTNRSLEPARQILALENITMEFTNLTTIIKDTEDQLRTQAAGTHADEFETSMMLYIAPNIVKMNLAKCDIHVEKAAGPLRRDANASTGLYSPTGAFGDPTLATREKGEILTEAMVAALVDAVKKLASSQ